MKNPVQVLKGFEPINTSAEYGMFILYKYPFNDLTPKVYYFYNLRSTT